MSEYINAERARQVRSDYLRRLSDLMNEYRRSPAFSPQDAAFYNAFQNTIKATFLAERVIETGQAVPREGRARFYARAMVPLDSVTRELLYTLLGRQDPETQSQVLHHLAAARRSGAEPTAAQIFSN